MSSIADIEAERNQFREQVGSSLARLRHAQISRANTLLQLDVVRGQLRDDPENQELQGLEAELKDVIALLGENIAELQPKNNKSTQPEKPADSADARPEKWSTDSAAAKKATPAVEDKEEAPVNYQVNDTVMAKWVSGDRAFYPAKITSITGSSTAPIYIVKFKGYEGTETLRAKDIRLASNKRKADGPPAAAAAPAPAPPAPGLVSSADATVYPVPNKDAQKDADTARAPKAKKIKAKRELEASKNKWQEFNTKSKFGKSKKKESMFRTPEGINGRGMPPRPGARRSHARASY